MPRSRLLSTKKLFLINGFVLLFLALAVLVAVLAFYFHAKQTGDIRSKAVSASVSYPSDILDLTRWKLTLPIGNPTEIPSKDLIGAINPSYGAAPYFRLNSTKTAVVFTAPTGGNHTSSSGYPRTELREMGGLKPYSITADCTANKGDAACWSSAIGFHMMTISQKVTHLPVAKSHVVIGQIHDNADDVTVFRLEGTTLYITNGDNSHWAIIDTNYQLGTPMTVGFAVSGNQTFFYYNGKPATFLADSTDKIHKKGEKVVLNKAYKNAYFKAGMYTQSACDGKKKVAGESCDAYGEVEISALTLCHGATAESCKGNGAIPTPTASPTPSVGPTATPVSTGAPSPTPTTTTGKISYLIGVSPGDSKVKLSWAAYPGTSKYKIFVDKYATGKYEQKSSTTSTSVSYSDLKSNQTSYFRVEAYDNSGNKIAVSDPVGVPVK